MVSAPTIEAETKPKILPRPQARPSTKRGSRAKPKISMTETKPITEPKTTGAPTEISPVVTFADLVRQANSGNESCLARLRQILDEQPEIWQRAGDIALLAERHWIDVVCAGNTFLEESTRRRLSQMKVELAGTDSTPIEKILIDLIGVTWLASFQAESDAAHADSSLPHSIVRQRRAESAQRRLLRAIKTLTTLRALVPRGLLPIASPRASK